MDRYPTLRLSTPGPDAGLAAVRRALPDGLALDDRAPVEIRRVYLDTFDWRVHAAGGTLTAEQGRDGIALSLHHGSDLPSTVHCTRLPRTAADLPPGHLSEKLAPVLDVRALTPCAAAEITRRSGRVTDADGNLVATVVVDRATPLGADDEPAADAEVLVRFDDPVAPEPIQKALAALREAGAVEHDELAAWAAVRDRSPGDYTSKPRLQLDPRTPAIAALRIILGELRTVVVRNLPGVLEDVDTEFLHDLRVAVRRSRSMLSQLKGVPGPEAAELATELKWIGQLTGPCRDLDVALEELPTSLQMVPDAVAADLGPLARHLRASRSAARRRLARSLRTRRFAAALELWDEVASGTGPGGDRGDREVAAVAAARIAKAHARVIRRGGRLGPDPAPDALHRLRIDAKKLRYLLEMFGPTLGGERAAGLVKELKKLQDLLGGFNDMHVQQLQLRTFAEEMLDAGRPPAATLMAMGRLEAALEERQEAFRLGFDQRFRAFADDRVAATFAALLEPSESP